MKLSGPVFVTGFMGTGKSKIGSLLAHRLGREFLDTDDMVEARAGKAISAIFAEDGEAAFRQLEHECLTDAAQRSDVVVSLGGGAIAQARNLELVTQAGVLVCIEADVDTILQRVSRRDDRPLLSGLDAPAKRARIEEMLAERRPYYERAHVRVHSTEERAPEETAELLLKELENWRANH